MAQKRDTLNIPDAELIFRNFAGKPTKFNKAGGSRSFGVILDQKDADLLVQQGWNIRQLQPRNNGDEPRYLLTIAVSYDNYPPKIAKKSELSKKVVYLNEDEIDCLDYDDIVHADIVVSPYHWEVNGNKGTKAYLKSLYVTIAEDPFAASFESADGIADEDLPF